MKKIYGTLLCLLVVGCGCSSWPAAHDDVVKLQSVFRTYRAHTQASNVSESATIEEIGKNIDDTLSNLETLTK